MNSQSLDRNLLFGVLALQVDLVDEDQFVAAMAKWASERTRPLGAIMVEQGALTPELRDALEPMVAAHIERHGRDAARSLSALSSTEQVRIALARVGGAVNERWAEVTRLGETTVDLPREDQSTIDLRGSQPKADRVAGEPAGRFRVLRPHARGGLGQVYVAQDDELGRQVALKEILADQAANPVLRSRFVLEAEINGNLEHPGIVPVYGLGSYSDGRPYYAMRFIEGDSLKEAIERFHRGRQALEDGSRRSFDSLEFRQLLRRFVDVCNAIGYAHSRGVLHRDLKPGNVMLGQYGETLVIDWGLAKATGHTDPGVGESTGTPLIPASGSSIERTEAGSMLGTPTYMSPEQAAGRIEDLGPASDLYSLGATLFAVLTGRPPVEGKDVVEVLLRAQSGTIDSPRSVVPGVPRPLEAICTKALELRPTDRYPTAKALADDVERWLADEPVSADREPWTERLRRWGRRNRTLVSTAATAALVALAGLGVVAAVQTRAKQQLSNKNDQLISANQARGRALDKATARVDLALQALGRFREAVDANLDVQSRPENVLLRNELLQTPIAFFRTLRDDLRDDPAARPEDRLKLAEAQLELAQLTRDIGNQAAALGAAGECVATLDALETDRRSTAEPALARRKLLAALGLQASLQFDNGRRGEGLESLERGVRIGEEIVRGAGEAESRLGLARLLAQSASASAAASKTVEALATLARARSILDDVPESQNAAPSVLRLKARLLDQTADLQARAGNPKQAIETLEAAIPLLRPLADGPDSDWISRELLSDNGLHIVRNRLALGKTSEAFEDLKSALEIRLNMLKERPGHLSNRLRTVEYFGLLSGLQSDMGHGEKALENQRESRSLLESARLENPRNVPVRQALHRLHSAIGYSLYNLGRVEEALGSFEQSIPVLEELVRIEPQVVKNRKDLAGNLFNIAVLRNVVGRVDASIEADLAALAIRRRMAAEFPDEPDYRFHVASSLGNLGVSYVEGKDDSATGIIYYREAEAVLAELQRAHPEVAKYAEYLSRSRSNLAVVLSRNGWIEEALAMNQKAEPYLASRVQAEPEVVQARVDLSRVLVSESECFQLLRRYDEAEGLGRRAEETLSALPEASRSAPEIRAALAQVYLRLGSSEASRGRHEKAVEQYSRSISIAQPDPAIAPTEARLRDSIRHALEGRAEADALLGRPDAARADWARLATLRDEGKPDPAPLGPILIRAWSGDAAGFLADAEAAVAVGAVKKEQLVTLARAASVALGNTSAEDGLTAQLADAAVAWLMAARAEGALASQGDELYLIDPRFDPIAERPEIRDLKADLTFPADPFVPETTAP